MIGNFKSFKGNESKKAHFLFYIDYMTFGKCITQYFIIDKKKFKAIYAE